MVNKCVVLNCDYNYESEKKKRALNCNNETIGMFEFPKHVVDPGKRWIARVPSENWYVSKTQKLHFAKITSDLRTSLQKVQIQIIDANE